MYCAERPERNGADGGGYQKGGGEKAGKKEEREKIETQEASQAVGTLPFSASLTSWLSCSNISSWQLVRDTSEIFDYKQRWVISLVSGFVKSTCYITKPKCWVYLDSTPVASAVLGELLWLQMLIRYSCDIYYQKLVIESFVNCHILNLGITLIFFHLFLRACVGPAWVFATILLKKLCNSFCGSRI